MAAPRRVGGWEVQGELGRGGQGVVLRARHAVHGTPAAIKLLLRQELKTVLRFRQEARVLERLNHPNLVRILEVGEHDGAPFLAMELVVGQSLADLVREGGPPPFPRTVKLLAAVARAVHHCHSQGVVHRDLKPENVIVERDTGRAVLVDFGMVKRDRELFGALSIDQLADLTRTGELRGTPLFMAPEQVAPSGEYGEVGPWTDVHALGAMLHVLLTGEPPWSATTLPTVVGAILFEPPPDPRATNPAVPAALARLCMKARAKQRADRPASAAAFAAALEAALRAGPARSRLVAGGLALSVVAAAGVGGALVARRRGGEVARAAPSTPVAPGPSAPSTPPTPVAPGPTTPTTPEEPDEVVERAIDWLADEPEEALALLTGAPEGLRARGVRALARLALERRAGGRGLEARAEVAEVIAADPTLGWATGADGGPDVRLLELWAERGAGRFLAGDLDGALADAGVVLALRPDAPRALVLRGRVRWMRRDGPGALRDAELALAVSPGFAPALRLRAEARLLLGDPRGALEDTALALRDDARDAGALLTEARARVALQDHRGAIDTLTRLLAVQPDWEVWHARASARSALGDRAAALEDLDEALKLVPAARREALVNILALRADLRRDAGDGPGAVADAERVVELAPDAKSWHELGRARRLAKDDAGAIEAFTRSAELYGETPQALPPLQLRAACRRDAGDLQGALRDLERATTLAPAVWNGWYDLGFTRQRVPDPPGALDAYSRAIELATGPDLANAYTARAGCHRALERFGLALADYDQALRLAPERWGLWHDRAYARDRTGDHAGALADYARALERATGADVVTVLLGRALCHRAEAERSPERAAEAWALARTDYDRALELAPGRWGVWHDRAYARQRAGDHRGAVADFGRAIALEAGKATCYRHRGTSLRALREWAAAEADAAKTLELEPNDGGAWSTHGWLAMRRGDLEEARRAFTRAIELGHDPGANLRLRAGVRRDLGDTAGALEDLALAVEKAPRSVDVLLARAYLLRDWRRDLAGARRDEDAAVALDAGAMALRSRALTRLAQGDGAGAREDAEEAVRRAVTVDTLTGRARVLVALGEAQAAEADAARAVALDPGSNVAHWAHALTLKACGDLAGAIAACGSAVAADPRSPRALATRAEALAALGRPADGLPDLDRAVALEPGRPDPLLLRAALRERLGDGPGAAADLRAALAVLLADDPRRAAASASLARLERGR